MKFHCILMAILIPVILIVPVAAADSQDSFSSAGALYSKSVDLANEGNYQEALEAADKALAMNETSLIGLIQSNRAGILVMMNRNDEAITAADEALAIEGNLTTVHSVAWYNKGNALRALGKISEARDAYSRAHALDNTLIPPDMSADLPVTSVVKSSISPAQTSSLPPTPKSPLSALLVVIALCVFSGTVSIFRK